MDYWKLLKKYTEIPGPGGHEGRVQREFMERARTLLSIIRA
jgi:putative aminopeptidase FrvX